VCHPHATTIFRLLVCRDPHGPLPGWSPAQAAVASRLTSRRNRPRTTRCPRTRSTRRRPRGRYAVY
jgi:hypothetical protein